MKIRRIDQMSTKIKADSHLHVGWTLREGTSLTMLVVKETLRNGDLRCYGPFHDTKTAQEAIDRLRPREAEPGKQLSFF